MEKQDPLIKPGRPRLNVDFTLVLSLRDEEHLGWTVELKNTEYGLDNG